MARIAISYRREDTGWITGRIFDRLKNYYEDAANTASKEKSVVFLDYDERQSALTFEIISNGLLTTAVFLSRSLVQTGWGMMGPEKRGSAEAMIGFVSKLRSPQKNIPVIPTLIDRTPMPSKEALPEDLRDLVYRQAAVIDTQIDFNSHIERLIRQIDQLVGEPYAATDRPSRLRQTHPRRSCVPLRTGIIYGLAALAICVAAIAAWLLSQSLSECHLHTPATAAQIWVTPSTPVKIWV